MKLRVKAARSSEMCELFAMASLYPATVRLSFEEFSRHGGLAGPHKDGWGIGFYEGRDVRLLREPGPASESACASLIREHSPASTLVLSHIRRATQGAAGLANCQPFARELAGRMHVFAHNGDLEPGALASRSWPGCYRPIGDTDSEHAFCALLERVRPLWINAVGVPPLADRLRVVAEFAVSMRPLGPANFLYADGDALFVHGDRRTHVDGLRPPGLHVLARSCPIAPARFEATGLAIESIHGQQDVVLAASVPLTSSEAWQPLAEGELIAVQRGRIFARVTCGAQNVDTNQPAKCAAPHDPD